ncbi:MAG: hypothetical protein M0Z58_07935 [Nitrospiraceae bacterium]|nr:hypothetical protein [Nitrospiraceae bacterium]
MSAKTGAIKLKRIKNLLLTGGRSSGKTTVIKKVIENLDVPANGFYTEEEWEASARVGLLIITLDGRKCRFAHRDINTAHNAGKFGVSIEDIENVAVPSIAPVDTNVIILDGIGKMECFSMAFREAVIKALDSSNIVVGTLFPGGDDFSMKIKGRKDVGIHVVTWNNRTLLPDFILGEISILMQDMGKKFPQ